MNSIVIEHVAINDLPAAWRDKLPLTRDALVTVRIEAETTPITEQTAMIDNPMFGMWKDRADTTDVAAFARVLRAPRYGIDGVDGVKS